MASSKEYLDFILEQLSELNDVSYRAMMGEFIIYYRGKIVGGRRVLRAGDGYLLVANGQYVGYCGDEDAPRWKNDAFYHYDRSNRQNHYAGGVVEDMRTPMTKDKVPDELSVFEAD